MRYFINAGHHNNDSGHVTWHGYRENEIVKEIRDKVQEKLPEGYYVPDHLPLRDSIDWVNAQCDPDDIAIDIHLNANNNRSIRGTECYYFRDSTLASKYARLISQALKIPNRGHRPDTQTWVGQLGWLRQMRCNSVVIEVCYLTNDEDRDLILTAEGKEKAAEAIVKGLKGQDLLPSTALERFVEKVKDKAEYAKDLPILRAIVQLLKSFGQ